MEGEALTTALACPHSLLGTGGEPHPNMSKVEDLIHLRWNVGRDPVNSPNVPL